MQEGWIKQIGLDEQEKQALEAVEQAQDSAALDEIRVRFLGKKGSLTLLLRRLGEFSKEERPAIGAVVNRVRQSVEREVEQKAAFLRSRETEMRLLQETLDVTLPGRGGVSGQLHPLTKVYNEIIDIFIGMGFVIEEGPEVELDRYNFEMLNMPADHPARDMHDTFYVSDNVVLRTHTSPVQVRTMLEKPLPIRMLSPGRVYRADSVDATHSPIFNQIEGLVVDKDITMGDLKGVLDVFAKELYGSDTKTRLRPSYFPFTEPSVEVDISCGVCGSSGCRVCKGTGWIEILGAGMVNPNVLRMCGIDPQQYSGFAFGLGLDRVTNMKYGITDIRLLYENDLRFLKQL
ncbi:MAG: phenylalanine--tRNA ligase subunit alpha [Christensenellales bacterium]|jgi:phenylalanyl-tRNA synthetase alpha chain